MKAVVGLFFSALFTTGACLKCEFCTVLGKTCNGGETTCLAGSYTCGGILTEVKIGGQSIFNFAKGCIPTSECNTVMKTEYNGVVGTATVTCDKAPSTVASLILCLSGLLLVKILL